MPTKLAALIAYLIGNAGAAVFLAFVLGLGTGFWPRESALDGVWPWLIDVCWLVVFAVHHSGMARQVWKRWLVRFFPPVLERSLYIAIAGVLLAVLPLAWQPLPGDPLWHGPLWIVGISLLAAISVGLCSGCCDHASFFGLQQAWTGNAEVNGPLRTGGPYRFVRHPLMLGLLITLWAQPIMPTELAVLNGGLTVYIVIAIRWEERDLGRIYGPAYEEYRKKVAMLIPFLV